MAPTGGTAASASGSSTASPAPSRTGAAPEPLLEPYYTQSVVWKPCDKGPTGTQCATVRAPIDYDQLSLGDVTLTMARTPAAEKGKRQGTLFVDVASFGEPALGYSKEMRSALGPAVRAAWDVVTYDRRGSGESGGFTCMTQAELDAEYSMDPTPKNAVELDAMRRMLNGHVKQCINRGGELARHLGAEFVARDLDVLRHAVGAEKLNMLGVRTGGTVAALYARLFTDRVGRVVLDTPVAPLPSRPAGTSQAEVDDDYTTQGERLSETFEDFLGECQDLGSDCPLRGDVATAKAQVIALIDKLEQTPISTGYAGLPKINGGWAATAIGYAIQDADLTEDLALALKAARTAGDGAGLAEIAAEAAGKDLTTGAYLPGQQAAWPAECHDAPVDGPTPPPPSAAVIAADPLQQRLDPWVVDPCQGVDTKRRTLWDLETTLTSPVLVMGDESDDPSYEDVESVADLLVGSLLVPVSGSGYSVLGSANTCAKTVLTDYLVKGTLPKAGYRCRAGDEGGDGGDGDGSTVGT